MGLALGVSGPMQLCRESRDESSVTLRAGWPPSRQAHLQSGRRPEVRQSMRIPRQSPHVQQEGSSQSESTTRACVAEAIFAGVGAKVAHRLITRTTEAAQDTLVPISEVDPAPPTGARSGHMLIHCSVTGRNGPPQLDGALSRRAQTASSLDSTLPGISLRLEQPCVRRRIYHRPECRPFALQANTRASLFKQPFCLSW
jgi:hypothetical protein